MNASLSLDVSQLRDLDLIQNYSKDRFIILRSAHKSAILLYKSGYFADALLSFRFILKECDLLIGTLPSCLINNFSFFVSDVNKFMNECTKQLNQFFNE